MANGTTTAARLPGGSDIWLFVIGDMLIFSAYFAAYLFVDRSENQLRFVDAQQHLSQELGIINTLLLLTSSLFVALSVQAARARDYGGASRLLTGGGACGVGFLFVKSYEWYAKIRGGFTIGSNAFFMHYYMLTGVHLLHVLIGLGFLAVLRRELSGPTVPRTAVLEMGAVYWHMVDFLWLLIFALLYLMR
jgi:nitric oxide reductase NorE protein